MSNEPPELLPPRHIQAEQEVLACLLGAPSIMPQIAAILEPFMFEDALNRNIYKTMLELHQAGYSVERNAIRDRLQQSSNVEILGLRDFLAALQIHFHGASPALYQASIVKEAWQERECHTAIAQAQGETDSRAAAVALVEKIQAIRKQSTTAPPTLAHELDELRAYTYELTEKRKLDINYLPGLRTGFPKLDTLLLGLHPGAFYIVGARPGMGKTLLATNIMGHVALKEKKRVAFYSFEMSKRELLRRMWTRQSAEHSHGVLQDTIRGGTVGNVQWPTLDRALADLKAAPLTIIDSTADRCHTIADIERWARAMAAQDDKPALVVIDHVLLIGHEDIKMDRDEQLTDISRRLKLLAQELQVPVLALCQLNRSTEGTKHRPTLASLRQCGAFEQDADCVLLLYRQEYYDQQDNKPTKEEDVGALEVIVAKHREGELSVIRLGFDGAKCRIFAPESSAEVAPLDPQPPPPKEDTVAKNKADPGEIRIYIRPDGATIVSDGVTELEVWDEETCLQRVLKAHESMDSRIAFLDATGDFIEAQKDDVHRRWAVECCARLGELDAKLMAEKADRPKTPRSLFEGVTRNVTKHHQGTDSLP